MPLSFEIWFQEVFLKSKFWGSGITIFCTVATFLSEFDANPPARKISSPTMNMECPNLWTSGSVGIGNHLDPVTQANKVEEMFPGGLRVFILPFNVAPLQTTDSQIRQDTQDGHNRYDRDKVQSKVKGQRGKTERDMRGWTWKRYMTDKGQDGHDWKAIQTDFRVVTWQRDRTDRQPWEFCHDRETGQTR